MRISTSLMYQLSMSNVTNAESSWLRAGEAMSTGKKIVTPSDDPIGASQIIVISQAQSQNQQYNVARTYATQRESLEDNILGQVVTVIQSAQQQVVNAGNGTLSDEDRSALATALEGMRDQLFNLANSTDGNGRYIFAGYKTDTPPFVKAADGSISYAGGSSPVEQKVDANRTMVIGHTGSDIFTRLPANPIPEPAPLKADGTPVLDATGTPVPPPPSESNVFTTLSQVITSLRVPVTTQAERDSMVAAVDKANRGLRNSFNNVLIVHAEVGVQLNELQNLNDLGAEKKLSLTMQKSRLEDIDWNAAASEYKLRMYALQAAYQTFNDMKGLSLFSLNR